MIDFPPDESGLTGSYPSFLPTRDAAIRRASRISTEGTNCLVVQHLSSARLECVEETKRDPVSTVEDNGPCLGLFMLDALAHSTVYRHLQTPTQSAIWSLPSV